MIGASSIGPGIYMPKIGTRRLGSMVYPSPVGKLIYTPERFLSIILQKKFPDPTTCFIINHELRPRVHAKASPPFWNSLPITIGQKAISANRETLKDEGESLGLTKTIVSSIKS